MLTQDALSIFLAGVEAVKPSHFIPRFIRFNSGVLTVAKQSIPLSNVNHIYIAAVGKAAAAMAFETEKILGDYISEGLVITKYEHAIALSHCRTIEAGHPVPDANSIKSGKALVSLFKQAQPNDIIIMLISGGASALLADCPPGCTLEHLQQTVQLLLDSGAPINEVNTIRKHLSQIKGGQLMKQTKAQIHALVLSDVPGDDLSVIASGLTVADNSSFEDCEKIINHYGLSQKLPAQIQAWLQKGLQKEIQDTPKAGDPVFSKVHNTIVASNTTSLKAAAIKSTALGYHTITLSSILSGEASEQAMLFTNQLKKNTGANPFCLLWGGETTVTIKGKGKGGRNQEFALAALIALQKDNARKEKKMVVLAGGTDGTDGPTDAAGAIADENIIDAAERLSIHADTYLLNNDAYNFFKQTKGLIVTGPTQTNVMDIIVGLVTPHSIG